MLFESLAAGIELFLTPAAIGLTLIGVLIGLLVGALPGLGPLMGIILLLPVAISLPPVAAMGFLIAIFVGGSCGGSISAILLRIPGTPLAAATLFDGYPMAQKGLGQRALGLAIGFGGVLWLVWDKAGFKPGAAASSPTAAVLACVLATACYGFSASFTCICTCW